MKSICVVTAARSEYGLLRWTIDEISKDPNLNLQLVVTGSHLSLEQGLTYKQIEEEGYNIDEKVEMLLSSETAVGLGKSMGLCSIGIASCLQRLNPDMILVLGDRYELLPICSVALVLGIPIAHVSGGDVTEGAIDNEVRNAITMLSSLHFPGVKESADNIIRMRNSDDNVYTVGEPGLENFLRFTLMSRQQIAESLNLDFNTKWALMTFHPETKLSVDENLSVAKNIIECLLEVDNLQIVISKSNADLGGSQLNMYWERIAKQYPNRFSLYSSLGQKRYLSFMHQAEFVIGNSSSGIVEAPFLGIPVINIGDRQKGRHLCKNVISAKGTTDSIKSAIIQSSTKKREDIIDTYYGDGKTASKIVEGIKSYFNEEV